MAASLGKFLVLKLDRVGAGTLERLDGAADNDRIAEAGIGVDDHRLRNLLAEKKAVLMPGAANTLSARVIEDLSFQAIYVIGDCSFRSFGRLS